MRLKAIVRQYISQIRPRLRADLEWFEHQPSLESAIGYAALAIKSNGKRQQHQRQLRKANLESAKHALLANIEAIEKSSTFDGLFDLVDAILKPIAGVGELYLYDTCLRIGAKLALMPKRVYLHAGTRKGAQALGLDGHAKALEVALFPTELQQLEPHEIEDLLCIFKSHLAMPN